jgi:hypothetical protein
LIAATATIVVAFGAGSAATSLVATATTTLIA